MGKVVSGLLESAVAPGSIILSAPHMVQSSARLPHAQLELQRLMKDALLDDLEIGVVACGADGRSTLFNRTAREWHGLDAHSVHSEDGPQTYHLSGADGQTPLRPEDAPWARAGRGEAVQNVEFTILAAGKPPRSVLATAATLRNERGDCAGGVAVMQDITVRKQHERRLAETNAELELRVGSRAAELEDLHALLRRREEELNHVSRLKIMGEMVTGLAHELNQPLTAVGNYVEACLQLVQEPSELDRREMQTWLEEIAGQAMRAGQIIQRLRRFVRKGEPHRSPVDVQQLVRDVADLVRPDAQLNEVSLQLDLQPDLPPVSCDAVQIQQVLVNLLKNSIEAVEQAGKPSRPIEVRCGLLHEREVLISVRDAGTGFSGIPPNQLFEPFFSTKMEGLGMGLAICRSIIEAHGGQIWAEPNPERGATFFFTLPI